MRENWLEDFQEKKRKVIESKESGFDEVLDISSNFYDDILDLLKERYRFSINNPKNRDSYSVSLWEIVSEDKDRPVLYHTGGMWQLVSQYRYKETEIEPTEEFFNLVGYGYHNMAVMTPMAHDFDDIVERLTDNIPKHEIMLADVLHRKLFAAGGVDETYLPQEVGPILSYVDMCTNFGVPDVRNYEMVRQKDISDKG